MGEEGDTDIDPGAGMSTRAWQYGTTALITNAG